MNQKNQTKAREYDIWLAWKVGAMKPKTVAHAVQGSPHGQLRSGIPGTDPCHVGAAFRININVLCHSPSLMASVSTGADVVASVLSPFSPVSQG